MENIKTYLKRKLFIHKESFKSELPIYIEKYQKLDSSLSVKTLKKEMKKAYMTRLIQPHEYYRYQFYNMPNEKRDEYIAYREAKLLLQYSKENTFPRHKYKRYLMFKDFFKRDIINISFMDKNEIKVYEEFCKKNEKFIVKPVDGTEGRGISIVSSKDFPTLDKLKELTDNKCCIIEELIIQGEEMAKLHPESINTVRFVTVLNSEGVFNTIYALARFGQGNSVVDNVGAGGIVAQIDIKTGEIISDGLTNDEFYPEHPDSHIKFKGYKLPNWDELCKIAEEAHKTHSEQHFIGWDFAWTNKGFYDVVEVNPFPSLESIQKISQKGIRPRFKEIGLL